jgi:hypothetical protein
LGFFTGVLELLIDVFIGVSYFFTDDECIFFDATGLLENGLMLFLANGLLVD